MNFLFCSIINLSIFPIAVYHFQIFEENQCCSRKTVRHYIYPAALRNPTSLAQPRGHWFWEEQHSPWEHRTLGQIRCQVQVFGHLWLWACDWVWCVLRYLIKRKFDVYESFTSKILFLLGTCNCHLGAWVGERRGRWGERVLGLQLKV